MVRKLPVSIKTASQMYVINHGIPLNKWNTSVLVPFIVHPELGIGKGKRDRFSISMNRKSYAKHYGMDNEPNKRLNEQNSKFSLAL